MEICFFVSFLFLFCCEGGGWGGVGGGGRGGVGGGVEVVGFRDTLVRSMLAACLGPAAKNMQLSCRMAECGADKRSKGQTIGRSSNGPTQKLWISKENGPTRA